MKINTKKTYKIYWQHGARYPWLALFTFLSVGLTAVVNAIYPLFLRDFINLLASQNADRATTLVALRHTLFIIAGLYLANWLFYRIQQFTAAIFEARVIKDLSDTCFSYLHKHSFTFFINNFAGSLVKKVKWFTGAFEAITDQVIYNLEPLVVQMVITLVILLRVNLWIGYAMIVWAILFIAFNWSFTKFKLKYDLARNETETESSGLLADTIAGHNNVRLFGGYTREVAAFSAVNEKLRRLRIITWNYLGNSMDGVQALLSIILEVGIFYYGIYLWNLGQITVGDFVLIQTLLIATVERIWNVGRIVRTVYERMSDAEEMTVILDTPHDIKDIPTAKKLKVNKGQIEFRGVTFNYNETRSILKDFNLTITPNERVAFIGTSGAGKTTIIRLILRLHELTAGKILIDDQNISKVKLESLWQAVSLVPQDPDLFHRTLLENIRYGRPDATDAEVEIAAKAANCHEFIAGLQDGYQTMVGERGIKLSGGERQRVAIARAILRGSPILILDEATSSLDSESEKLIQGALANLMKGKTVIVVAHRLSTIRQMNRIIVIDGGKIAEEGTHDALLEKTDGVYHRLWELQAGGFIK
ncbi:MAG: ABC transporter ATP-binding protein [Candidatus Vogelbacteria bacterium]|nr:ABC transporter ATP-binding protein [Candidatus Vogelbacteria bacterium]